MSVEFDRESPGSFDWRTLNRTTLNRWTGRSGGAPPLAASSAAASISVTIAVSTISIIPVTYATHADMRW